MVTFMLVWNCVGKQLWRVSMYVLIFMTYSKHVNSTVWIPTHNVNVVICTYLSLTPVGEGVGIGLIWAVHQTRLLARVWLCKTKLNPPKRTSNSHQHTFQASCTANRRSNKLSSFRKHNTYSPFQLWPFQECYMWKTRTVMYVLIAVSNLDRLSITRLSSTNPGTLAAEKGVIPQPCVIPFLNLATYKSHYSYGNTSMNVWLLPSKHKLHNSRYSCVSMLSLHIESIDSVILSTQLNPIRNLSWHTCDLLFHTMSFKLQCWSWELCM